MGRPLLARGGRSRAYTSFLLPCLLGLGPGLPRSLSSCPPVHVTAPPPCSRAPQPRREVGSPGTSRPNAESASDPGPAQARPARGPAAPPASAPPGFSFCGNLALKPAFPSPDPRRSRVCRGGGRNRDEGATSWTSAWPVSLVLRPPQGQMLQQQTGLSQPEQQARVATRGRPSWTVRELRPGRLRPRQPWRVPQQGRDPVLCGRVTPFPRNGAASEMISTAPRAAVCCHGGCVLESPDALQ